MDPITIALLASKGVQAGINYFRGNEDLNQAQDEYDNLGGVPNYTLSGDYDRMVNMALNAPQTGEAMAERAYADQAEAAGAYGSRGLGSLNAATRNLATTTSGLEAQRLQGITSALGTRAGAEQSVLNQNTAADIQERNFDRNRIMNNMAAAGATRDAGIEGMLNIAGAGVAGLAGGLQADNFGAGFGSGFESFYNPTNQSRIPPGAKYDPYTGMPVADKGATFMTPGKHDHNTNEFMIARMVKTAKGTKLEPMGVTTGSELHEFNEDDSMSVYTGEMVDSLHDGYLKDKKKGRKGGALRRAARAIFEKNRFKR